MKRKLSYFQMILILELVMSIRFSFALIFIHLFDKQRVLRPPVHSSYILNILGLKLWMGTQTRSTTKVSETVACQDLC